MLAQPLTDFALVQRAGLNIEELYREEKKKNRGFANYRTSYGDRNVGSGNQNQSGSSNTVSAVNEKVRREFTDLGRPLSTVLRSCIKNGVLSKLPVNPAKPVRGRYMDRNCDYHQCKGHSTDECSKMRHDIQDLILRHDIQDLIDSGTITKPTEKNKPSTSTKNNPLPQYQYNYPPHKSQSGGSVNAIESGLPEELVLAEAEWEERTCAMLNIWDDCSSSDEEEGKMPVKIEIEKSITVKVGDVPENEDEQIQLAIQKSLVDQEEQWYYSSEEDVNEVGVQSLTRSGRVYNPDSSMKALGEEIVVNEAQKRITEKGGEEPKQKKKEQETVKVQKKTVEVGESSQNRAPSGVTANSVLSQLQRTRADISLWDLLIASKEHRESLLEAMTFVRVPAQIQSVDMINVLQCRIGEITFFDSDLPLEGRNHFKPLYIQIVVNGRDTRNVMVDNGSALCVCPLKMLSKFRIEESDLEPSNMVVKAYDNTMRNAKGTFKAKISMGVVESWVDVVVLDILANYALLLGRPWLHPLGAVPSTLHRKVKIPWGADMVTVNAQEDLNVGDS
ncbi:uncharacterized protein LOC119371001 [Jatropha curcas]|uniref:uncharacterized protein LOC119371001 n=1 Tax=Jatropha curcas TaxID=180498 RepID=UPI0018939BFA|nr:uncharacterized protein LOC119371001 [Jatropha curcas]